MYNNPMFNNYYRNPYFTNNLVKNLPKKSFSWNGFLDNAQRTLNVINQAMPIYKEVKPVFSNVGTILKVINGINAPTTASATQTIATQSPTFFA